MTDRIRQFLGRRCVLITGSTGFLGKPLVEKLLHTAPDIDRIYLLIRSRSGGKGEPQSAQERFEREILATGAFNRLKETWGKDFRSRIAEKVRVVDGDISASHLGLSDEDWAELTSRVQVVINSAAVVVFDERLDAAVELNTLAPRRLVEFAQACRDAILLHVSTAYVNGTNPDVAPEALLPVEGKVPEGWRGPVLPADLASEVAHLQSLCRQAEAAAQEPERMRSFVREAMHVARAEGKTRDGEYVRSQTATIQERWTKERLIQVGMERAKARGWNDTYTFTKAMGEQMVAQTRGDLPTAIIRPSIIESSLVEPEPGWIDGLRMADPIIVAFGKGRVPDFPADPSIVMDLIPVDFVVNAMLAALPDTAEKGGLSVYQVATGTRNPLRFRALYDHTRAHFRAEPMLDRNGLPVTLREWSFPDTATFRRRHRRRYLMPLRACLAFVEWLPRNKRTRRWRFRVGALLSAAERLDYYTVIYGPYIHHSYLFDTTRTQRLFEALHADEKVAYPFDTTTIDWHDYIERVHIPGLKRNVLKMGQGPVRAPIAEEEILDARVPSGSDDRASVSAIEDDDNDRGGASV
ncbi:hypothetical protein FJZ36_05370 [Candidatus Poribacteria bacterium]|nr:hypothetical protein [Candidatus Poribacteria bacterium]